jgi:hypothetical protein
MGNAKIRVSNDRSLNNSNVSDEGKGRTQAVLDQDVVGDHPHEELYNAGGDQNKDLTRVTAGLRA